MRDKENELADWVAQIRSGQVTREIVDSIRDRIKTAEFASALVSDLLMEATATCTSRDAALAETMSHLESIAELDQATGVALMAHLWAIARQVIGAFDVCDGIDLWLHQVQDPLVEVQFRYLIANSPDLSVQEYYRGLVAAHG